MARKGPAEFKGKLNGLYLNVDTNESYTRIMSHLKKILEESGAFYKGSKIIGLTGQKFTYKQKAEIEELLFNQYGIEVESLEEEIGEIRKTPEPEPIQIPEPVNEPPPVVDKPVIEQSKLSDTKFVFGTLRSGKSVHYPGNVILIGDINPGAEIIAEGNIVVMGRILGFVHAGSAGLESAVIVANLLKPTQIRIAKLISVPPSDDHSEHTLSPEIASVSKGIIKIEKCH
ncbi:MAG: septum site-determining protein MinC [Clostridiales bacterium]|nr:septum site-determining protein MinC [Clostridiales bacterium]